MTEQNKGTMDEQESVACVCCGPTQPQNGDPCTIEGTLSQSLAHGPQSGESLCGTCRRVYEEWLGGVYFRCSEEDYAEEFQRDIHRYTPADSWDQFADPGDGPEERLERAGQEEPPHAQYPEDYVD
jgi:hypothetical protein